VHGLLRSSSWAIALVLLGLGGPALAEADDRPALSRFAATGVVASRRLQQDLARASWPQQQLRQALTRAYGLSTKQVSRYLDAPAGLALLLQQTPWWSPELAPPVKLAALRAAIVADSGDGSVSLLGVLQRLPVSFALAESQPAVSPTVCGCPQDCGSSALAHLAFLMACLQAGASSSSGR